MMSKVLGIIVARLALKIVSLREFIEVLERRRKLTHGFIKVHSNRSTFTKQQQPRKYAQVVQKGRLAWWGMMVAKV